MKNVIVNISHFDTPGGYKITVAPAKLTYQGIAGTMVVYSL